MRIEGNVEQHDWQAGPSHFAGATGLGRQTEQCRAVVDGGAVTLLVDAGEQTSDVGGGSVCNREPLGRNTGHAQLVDSLGESLRKAGQ